MEGWYRIGDCPNFPSLSGLPAESASVEVATLFAKHSRVPKANAARLQAGPTAGCPLDPSPANSPGWWRRHKLRRITAVSRQLWAAFRQRHRQRNRWALPLSMQAEGQALPFSRQQLRRQSAGWNPDRPIVLTSQSPRTVSCTTSASCSVKPNPRNAFNAVPPRPRTRRSQFSL